MLKSHRTSDVIGRTSEDVASEETARPRGGAGRVTQLQTFWRQVDWESEIQ